MGSDPADAGRDASVCPVPETPPPEPLATPAVIRFSRWPSEVVEGGAREIEARFPLDPAAMGLAYRVDACEFDRRALSWPLAPVQRVEVTVDAFGPLVLTPQSTNAWSAALEADVPPGARIAFRVVQTAQSGLGERRFEGTMPSPLRGVAMPGVADGGTPRARRDRPFRVTWIPACGDIVRIVLLSPDNYAQCDVPGDPGAYEIPTAVLREFAPSSNFRVNVSVLHKQVSSWGPYPRVVFRVANGAFAATGTLE